MFIGFSGQEYWSWLPLPPPGDLADQGIEPASLASPALQVDSLLLSHWGSQGIYIYIEREISIINDLYNIPEVRKIYETITRVASSQHHSR